MHDGERDTKKALCESFKQLIQEHPFENITIKMITDRSGVIRPTFYNYFRDKQEVYECILQEELIDTLYTLIENNMDREALKMIFFYFGNNRNLYKHLFKISGQNSFKEILFQQFYDVYETIIEKKGYSLNKEIRLLSRENIARFYSSGITNILEMWLTNDKIREQTSDEIFEAYIFLLTHSLIDILNEK